MVPSSLLLQGAHCPTVQPLLLASQEKRRLRSAVSLKLPAVLQRVASIHLRKPSPAILNGEMDWNHLHKELETEYQERYELHRRMADQD